MIRHMSYLDLPVEVRRESARIAISRYQAVLTDPVTSKEQLDKIYAMILRITRWEQGTCHVKR
jgi:hypothetical protein